MVLEIIGGVLVAQEPKHRQELEKGAGPAMNQDDGDGVWSGGEEGSEVNVKFARLVIDGDFEVGKRVDVVFGLSPSTMSDGRGLDTAGRNTSQSRFPTYASLR